MINMPSRQLSTPPAICYYHEHVAMTSTTSGPKLMSLGLCTSQFFKKKIDKAMWNRFLLRSGLSNDMQYA